MRLFAISDLHLSLGVDKPMDIFGPHWAGHDERMQQAWDGMVTDEDWVLLGGDLSWGLSLEEALPDLAWVGERPGQKILIKGNHCMWWASRSKVQAVIHDSLHLLQYDAIKLGNGTVILGTRLWDPPDAPWADENAEKIFNREIGRLKMSIQAASSLGGERRVALIHYPPKFSDGRETAAVPLLRQAGVSACIYGHLHGNDHRHGFQGEADGIQYYLTSCDAIDFAPIEIPLPPQS